MTSYKVSLASSEGLASVVKTTITVGREAELQNFLHIKMTIAGFEGWQNLPYNLCKL